MLISLLILLSGSAYFVVLGQRTGISVVLLVLLLEWFCLPLYGDWAADAGVRISASMSLWTNTLFNLFTIVLALVYVLTVLGDVFVIPARVELIRLRVAGLSSVCGVVTLLLVLIAPLMG